MEFIETLGEVTANNDPAFAGRIKCKFAEIDGREWPDWISPIWPSGWLWVPEPGDTVSVLMPNSDDAIEFSDEIKYKGVQYDQDTSLPEGLTTNYPHRRGFQTKEGHLFFVEDKGGDEEFSFVHKSGMLVSMTKNGMYFGTLEADEPFVLGEVLKGLLSDFLGSVAIHTHPNHGTPPNNAADYVGPGSIDSKLPTALSDFIFGQKAKP